MRVILTALSAALALALASQAPAQTTVVNTTPSVATVLDTDHDSRRALLQEEDGSQRLVVVATEAGGLENVKAGDAVQVSTIERTFLSIAPASSATGEATGASTTVYGERDALPARDDENVTRQVVEIVSVTKGGDQIRYRNPDYTSTWLAVLESDVREFARTLKAGDKVLIETRETVILSTIAN